jgi:hypothetical protein
LNRSDRTVVSGECRNFLSVGQYFFLLLSFSGMADIRF